MAEAFASKAPRFAQRVLLQHRLRIGKALLVVRPGLRFVGAGIVAAGKHELDPAAPQRLRPGRQPGLRQYLKGLLVESLQFLEGLIVVHRIAQGFVGAAKLGRCRLRPARPGAGRKQHGGHSSKRALDHMTRYTTGVAPTQRYGAAAFRRALPFLALIALTVFPASLQAQAQLSVDLQDPVYQLLENGELRGVLSRLSALRPYSRIRVRKLLERMGDNRARFGRAEQAVLEEALRRFGEEPAGLRHGNVGYRRNDGTAARLQVGGDARFRARLNVNSPENWHLDSVFRSYLRGDLTPWLSYFGVVGFTLDRVRSEETFAPYSFTKQWDAIHVFFGSPPYSDGSLDYPTISFDLETEVAAQLLRDTLRLGLARHRREWGIGDGSLTLGGSARPFVGAELHAELAPWLVTHQLLGSLNNWALEPGGLPSLPGFGELSYQKLFALQRLEILPFPWLYVSASGSMVGTKRFELTYAAPLLFKVMAQNLIGNPDNVGVGVDLAVTLPPFGRAYVSFFADEMDPNDLSELFTRPRNMFALQGGLKAPIPWLPFTTLTLQYTKIEPFTYAHYPSDYFDYSLPVDMSYTHDGENLAYPLWPNSDEFLLKLTSVPAPRLRASLEYRVIRHGDNPNSSPGDPAILGRPDGYLDYSAGIDSYPDKDFLRDGLYDHNHIVTLSADYAIPNSPVTVGLSYTFAYSYWEPNDSLEPDRPHQLRNIFGIEVRVFR